MCRPPPWVLYLWITFIAGCSPDEMVDASPRIVLEPSELTFTGWVGHRAVLEATVRNERPSRAVVTLEASEPFSLPKVRHHVPGHSSIRFEVAFDPTAPGEFSGILKVAAGDQVEPIELVGAAAHPPPCPDPTPCLSYVFEEGSCRPIHEPDGVTCDGGPCLEEAKCYQGKCLGASVQCPSDDLACTFSACDPIRGCIQVPKADLCPETSDPCLYPICDLQEGCGVAEAPDGSPCGPLTCGVRAICFEGTCQETPVADGSHCDGLCGPGACHEDICVEPPGSPLPILAQWNVPEGYVIAGPLRIDRNGNALTLLRDATPLIQWLVSIDPQGRERFRVPLNLNRGNRGYGFPRPHMSLAGDLAIVYARLGPVIAFDTNDGTVRWRRDLASESPLEIPYIAGIAVTESQNLVVLLETGKVSPTRPPAWELREVGLDGSTHWTTFGGLAHQNFTYTDNLPIIDEAGNIYFRGREAMHGRIHSVSPEGSLRWSVDESLDLLAVASGRLYLGDYKTIEIRRTIDGTAIDTTQDCFGRSHIATYEGLRVQLCWWQDREPPWHLRGVDESSEIEKWRIGTDLTPPGFLGRAFSTHPIITDRPSILVKTKEWTSAINDEPKFSLLHELTMSGGLLRSCGMHTDPFGAHGELRLWNGILSEWGPRLITFYSLPGIDQANIGWSTNDGDARSQRRAR